MSLYRVLVDFKGAISGCYVKQFHAGCIVEIDDADLISVAMGNRWIESAKELPEEKSVLSSPKNKARKSPPKVKAE